ncbi:MAG: L,D-transpeptidase family protein [Candidatus Moranbacteria bacterium]|nr:L,D-transpeptidase family protein [Candidatus Moranbacteria bacterium]MDD3964536.1 L,D-transpeptidase family protein [Candidatus Moranbacteria bacterium]
MHHSFNPFFWFLFVLVVSVFVLGTGYLIRDHYASATVTLKKDASTGPREPIIVHFSQPMRPESLSGKILLSKNFPLDIEWLKGNTEAVLVPKNDWPLATSFELSVLEGKTKYLTKSTATVFAIKTLEKPTIASITPAPGSRDVLLGIEDPLKIVFDESVQDFYIDFRIDTLPAVVNEINPERTIFEVLPQSPLLPNKEYALDISVKWKDGDDSSLLPITHSTFTTAALPKTAENTDPTSRSEFAKKSTQPKKTTGKYIDISLASQTMTLFENGQTIDVYIVSSGKRGMDTPTGEFSIHNKSDRPWSKKYGLYMPYWMAFVPSGLFGIHELPEWPGGYKEGANHLGTPVSHGCVRLGVGPAKRVFEWADVGTPVIIY